MPQSHSFKFFNNHLLQGRATLLVVVKAPAGLKLWVRQALAVAWPHIPAFTQKPWQLSLRVANAAEAQTANQQFRQKSYVPDVLTFPLWEGINPVYAGDILLCWGKLSAEAKAQHKPLKAHLQHLVVHSLLHLAGEDHLTPQQAKHMEAQEIAILKLLGWPNPYEIG